VQPPERHHESSESGEYQEQHPTEKFVRFVEFVVFRLFNQVVTGDPEDEGKPLNLGTPGAV